MSLCLLSDSFHMRRISAERKLVLMSLSDSVGEDGIGYWPSLEKIARIACCTLETASAHIDWLRAEGYVLHDVSVQGIDGLMRLNPARIEEARHEP